MHSRTTAREILADFAGERLDYWVTGFGTGGTLKGVARVLRRSGRTRKIVVCEPDNAPLLGSGIAQARNADGTPAAAAIPRSSRTRCRAGRRTSSPSSPSDAVDAGARSTAIVPIAGADALRCRASWRSKEGIFVGISARRDACRRAAGLRRRAPTGATILCMLPDTGERYLSTPLFADIAGRHDRGGAARSRARRRACQLTPKA